MLRYDSELTSPTTAGVRSSCSNPFDATTIVPNYKAFLRKSPIFGEQVAPEFSVTHIVSFGPRERSS